MRIISDLNPNKEEKLRDAFPKEFAIVKYDDMLSPPLDTFITSPGKGLTDIEEVMIRLYLFVNRLFTWVEYND